MSDQVIDATFAPGDVKPVEVKSFWSACKGIASGIAAESWSYTKKMSKEVVAPAVCKAASITATSVNNGLGYVVQHGGEFLETHDNIAIVLSPGTAVRYFAVRAIDRKFKAQAASAVNTTVTTQL